MIKRLFQSLAEKVGIESWSLNQGKVSILLFYLLILFLPTQLGKHFWPQFSFVYGLRLDYLSPTLYLTDILIALIFVLSLSSIKVFLKKINKKYIIYYLLYVILICIPLPFSKNPLAGAYGVLKLLELSFLFIYIYFNFKKFNKKLLVYIFSFGIIFESILSILQYINRGSLGGILYFLGERSFSGQTPGIANASINGQLILRPYGTFSHPNVLAGYQLISTILVLVYAFKQGVNKKIISLALIIGSVSVVLTLSRVALILWAFFMLYLFGLSLNKKYKKTISNPQVVQKHLRILFFISFAFLILLTTPVVQRLTSFSVTDETVTQRQYLIDQSIGMIKKNPVLGVGINNFYDNLSFVSTKNKPPVIQPVHNIFLMLFSQMGILGLSFFIYLLYSCFIFLRKTKPLRNHFLILFITVITLGVFDHYFLTIQQGQLLFTIILATALSYTKGPEMIP